MSKVVNLYERMPDERLKSTYEQLCEVANNGDLALLDRERAHNAAELVYNEAKRRQDK